MSETRPSVLVVDDDASSLTTLHAILETEFEVASASSPRDALAQAKALHAAVIVCDWQMPQMDGVTLYKQVLAQQGSIACVLVTGQVELLRATVDLAALPTVSVLKKPVDPEALLRRVKTLAHFVLARRTLAASAR